MKKNFDLTDSNGFTDSIFKLSFVHWLVVWTLSFFVSQIVWANPDGQIPHDENHLELSEKVEISVKTYDSPEEYLSANPNASEDSAELPVTNFLTLTKPARANHIKNIWSRVINKGMYYVEYPTKELAKHFSEQVNFYQTEKYSLVVLTAMTATSVANWFFIADQGTMSQKSFIVAMNAMLYGYLLVNVKNWQTYLKHSENIVEKMKRLRRMQGDSSPSERLFANMGANFTFFLLYNLSVQGVLNWSDLTALYGHEMISFMLTNSVLGVATTGVWDSTFRKWFLEGKINTTSLVRLNWAESFVMTTIHAFIAMGHPEGYFALGLHGAAGATSLILSTDKVRSGISRLADKAKWTYQRGRVAVNALTSQATTAIRQRASIGSASQQMCGQYLAQ